MTAPAGLSDAALLAAIEASSVMPPEVLDAARGVFAAAAAVNDWRALTVKQPWASALVGRPGGSGGPKDVENRTRRTNHRGPILIHAGQRYDHDHAPTRAPLSRWMRSGHAVTEWTFGAVVGMAVIEDCHQCDGSCSEWAEPGAWHWTLGERRALREPVGARGALGLWRPPVGVAAEVLGQLAAQRASERLRTVSDIWTAGMPAGSADDELLAGCPLFPVPETTGATP